MALLSPQEVDITGLEAVYTAVNATETIPRRSGLVLHVVNANVGDTTVTITVPGVSEFGQANPDVAVVVTAAEERFIHIPNDPDLLNATGVIDIAYSVTSSVTAALLELTA